MGYLMLVAGLAIFVAAHLIPAAPAFRARLVARLGETPYKGLNALASLAGFALIVYGWSAAPRDIVYVPPYWLRHVTLALMWPTMILLVAAYVPAGRIKAAVKHPMILAVKVWAFSHLLANGDVASLILFTTFLAWAVADRISLKRRGENGPPAGPLRNDAIAVLLGTAAYVVFAYWLHPLLIGVPAVS